MHPLRKTVVSLCLLLWLIGAFIQPVLAQATNAEGEPAWLYFWRVEGDFKDDRMHFKWIVTAIPQDAVDAAKDIIVIDITEQCTITGPGVTIFAEAAHFAGGDWIQCEIPNFVETVKAKLGIAIEEGCQCNFNAVVAPFAGANFTVAPGTGQVPLATWSKLRLFAGDQQTSLFVDQNVFESNIVNARDAYQRSTFIGLGASAILRYLADLYGPFWWLWHKELQEAVANPDNFLIGWLEGGAANNGTQQEFKYELDPNDQMLYIGFDRATGTTLKGSIRLLLWDPGCGVRGGW